MKVHAWLNVCIMFCIIPNTLSWGKLGHFVSSKIALSLLSENGNHFLSELYGASGKQLEQIVMNASIWPDSVSNTPAYDWSWGMHFGTTPDGVCDGFKLNRDCNMGSRGCTVMAIANYTERAVSHYLPLAERQEALSFVIHFVADIHQPLHVGFTGDRGGNSVHVYPPWDMARDPVGRVINSARHLSLHYLWDSHILAYTLWKSGASWSELAEDAIDDLQFSGDPLPTSIEGSVLDHFNDIASDSSDLACSYAYSHDDTWVLAGTQLPIEYYDEAETIIWDQLIKSGIEIARVINMMGESVYGH